MPNKNDWRALYPFSSHFLQLDVPRYHYVDEGRGDVLLMVHGNPTWSFYWRDLITALRDRYRIVAPDHIGCGLSDKPADYPYSLARHTANLVQLIDRLQLDNMTLLGHDWGGAIGMGYAVRHPENIRRIVVLNTGAFRSNSIPFRIAVCGVPVLGDLLVRLESAVGNHKDDLRNLDIHPENCRVFHEKNHFDLLDDERVHRQIVDWFRSS